MLAIGKLTGLATLYNNGICNTLVVSAPANPSFVCMRSIEQQSVDQCGKLVNKKRDRFRRRLEGWLNEKLLDSADLHCAQSRRYNPGNVGIYKRIGRWDSRDGDCCQVLTTSTKGDSVSLEV